MKKLTALILVLVFLVPLIASCDKPQTTATAEPTAHPTADASAAIYVAVDGDDTADGTKEKPLATVNAAVAKALALPAGTDAVVSVGAGEYFMTDTVVISTNDLGSLTIVGDGEAVLTGGLKIPLSDFAKADDEVTALVPDAAKEFIYSLDLTKYGYNAEKYAKATPDKKSIYIDDTCLTLARYPDTTFLEISDAWNDETDASLSEIKFRKAFFNVSKTWHETDDMYVYGYPYYTWYSQYGKVLGFDYDKSTVSVDFLEPVGAYKGYTLSFINFPDVLDYENEFYIAPDGKLYIYANDLTIGEYLHVPNSDVTYFRLDCAENVTFRSLKMDNSYGTAISGKGNGITVENCEICRMGNAVILSGSRNTISSNYFHNMFERVIKVDGGDPLTLTSSETVIENNEIKNFADNGYCWMFAVQCDGVGHLVAHNKISGSVHEAVAFYGNNNILEYNEIFDVCLTSSDAGGIHYGRSNLYGGNIIRYNFFHDIGRGSQICSGIYFDDCVSGQTAYGNVICNMTGNGFMVGGGRAHNITGNLIISCKNGTIEYDQRGYDGQFGTGSWKLIVDYTYETFADPRYDNEIWREAFPWLFEATITDTPDPDDPLWLAAPGGSTVKNNVYVITDKYDDIKKYDAADDNGKLHYKERIKEMVYRFSDVEPLEIIKASLTTYSLDEIASLDLPDFIDIPFDKIGINPKTPD